MSIPILAHESLMEKHLSPLETLHIYSENIFAWDPGLSRLMIFGLQDLYPKNHGL